MNRRKSSQPEDTETVDVFTFVRASVARLISSRRPAIVPAGRLQCREQKQKKSSRTLHIVTRGKRMVFYSGVI